MLELKWIGRVCVAASFVLGLFALSEGDVLMFASAVGGVVAGVVLLALERIVSALESIRDSLRPHEGVTDDDTPVSARPGRNMEEIEAGINAAKQRSGLS